VLAAALGGCSDKSDGFEPVVFEQPETAVTYEILLKGSTSDEITDLAELSLDLYLLQDEGAVSPAFLRRRAESDLPLMLKILRSRGYYSSSAEAALEEVAPGTMQVTVTIEPGPAYILREHRLVAVQEGAMAPPALDAASLGSPVGGQALSAEIAIAEAAAATQLRQVGFPYATFSGRSGLADPEAATLEVESTLDTGPAYLFGPVTFAGLKTIDEDYLRSYLPWSEGEAFDISKLREFQRRLSATDLFSAAAVRIPETPPPGTQDPAPLPVSVELEEGPRRRITGGLRYDTDLGASVRATFEHRNLFGANERLLIEADVGQDELSLNFGVRKPQFLRPGQDLLFGLSLKHTDIAAYDADTADVSVGLERQMTDHWRGGVGVLGEISDIDDNEFDATAQLLGVPIFAAYEGSNNLLNPTNGERLWLGVTPFVGVFDHEDTEFLVLDAIGSVYRPLDDERKYVIAARGRMASVLAPDLKSVPATRRLYSGGGGSVRGYALDVVGPLDNKDDPVGGRSTLELGMELRARLFDDIGGVVFADAGSVSTAMFPDFEEGIQVAAGLGLRYHTPIGPIRLDVAFPLNGRSSDDVFQFYFSIGQAF
jgi:translocation and assembly module TamA